VRSVYVYCAHIQFNHNINYQTFRIPEANAVAKGARPACIYNLRSSPEMNVGLECTNNKSP
jgi:hypothetical protein